MNYQEVCQKYGNCLSWLEYQSLKEALPSYWLFLMQKELIDDHISLREFIGNTKNFTKIAYRMLNEKHKSYLSARKLQKKLQGDYNATLQETAFKNVYKVTNVTKLRNFQFRLLYNTVYCNNILYYWRKKPNQNCDFCNEPKQDIRHLMYYCPYVYRLWTYLESFSKEIGISVNINLTSILYNCIDERSAGSVINFIVLIIKFYVYRCKCSETPPNITGAIMEVELMEKIEYNNACINNKVDKHKKKWGAVLSLLRMY